MALGGVIKSNLARGAALALTLLCPLPAFALDSASVKLIDSDNKPLKDSLTAASVTRALLDQTDITVRDVVAAAQGDYATMVETLYAQGYYSAVVHITLDGVEAARIDPFNLPAKVDKVRIRVNPGPRFKFGATQLAPLAPNSTPSPGFAPDEPALATTVREAVQGAVTDWRAAGYAKANVAGQEITADHNTARLNVGVQLDPGPRLRFGDVNVSGETTVKPARVRQIAGIPRGDRFHPDDVDKAASRLRRTGTFQSVQIKEAETPNPDGSLDLDVTVIDRKPRRIGGGVEFSTLDGVTLSGFWLHRNILGGAERLRIDGIVKQLGAPDLGTDAQLVFRFEKPAVYGPDTLFFAEAELAYEDEPDYLERRASLTFGASREFNEHLTGELGIGLSFSRVTDRFAAGDPERDLRLFTLPAKLTYDRRDDPLDARSGYYLSATLTPFHDAEASQNGARFTFDGRGYQPVGDSTVLAARLQLGSLTGPDAPDAPPGFLFYSGGSGTVRGQPYQSLGATHSGEDLGGKALAAASAEIRYSITDTIGLVGFADAGFVGADGFNDGDFHAGAGLGLRYKTPVGPIRLDVAGPIAGDTGKGVQLYIGIGQAF
ncbi:outer membrane protein assembly factor [Tropicibacter sp. R15_0]|uniref:autotransporter assembly complex protein TamA n=1 Tax=Tropicibacter sp. R15_0 TaxID=2821101 RepID=UPI001ADC4C7B|nr:autotransporter assembly complex family protein [Tropicibacter sp. R15_0]MBO9467932.1 outer membrane protein assembly factor [Tropicibacter sp. R15_0]